MKTLELHGRGQGGTELRKLMFNISTMEELGEVLSSRDHFRENLQTALLSLMGSIPVARGALLLRDRNSGDLVLAATRGTEARPGLRIELSAAPARALLRRRRPLSVHAQVPVLTPWLRRTTVLLEMGAELVAPLRFKEELVGIVVLGLKYTGEAYNPADLELIMVMANFIALGVHNQELFRHLETANTALRRKVSENKRLYRNLESIFSDTVRALGAAIDAKDPFTRGHSDRVARIAVAIGRALGLPELEISALRIASHLHDIGKIAVDNSILLKAGRLDQEEMVQIHRHPMVSFDILSNIAFPYPDVALIARHHHEWVDGSGYPDRLGVKELLPGMKIICLADSFDAMTSDRPYRPALKLKEAVGRIREGVRVQFDPRVTRAFLEVLRAEVRGEAATPEILTGVDMRFSAASMVGSIDRFLGELQPVHG
jgi:HD-GYP domain-containing protein (c-di-GMP phosphodiesterase class II)